MLHADSVRTRVNYAGTRVPLALAGSTHLSLLMSSATR